MNSVIIVDDESLVIKSLKASVEWNRLGYEVIGEAGNGIEAYDKILEYRPDIVFTDIRMPGYSGLELIKKVNDVLPNIQFVVMSGYAEFVYVQKALSYGALGYCLKPFDETEIESILKRANSIIQRNKWSLETEMLTVIDDVSEEGCARRKELIRMMGFNWEEGEGVNIIVSKGNVRMNLDAILRPVSFKIGKNKFAQMVLSKQLDTAASALSDLDCETNGAVGVSNTIYSADNISGAIEKASIALNQYFVTGRKAVYRYFEPEESKFMAKILALRNSVTSGDTNETIKQLDLFEAPFSKGEYNVIQAFQVYSVVMYSNAITNNIAIEELIYNYEQLMNTFKNAKDMLSSLKIAIRQNDPSGQSAFTDIKNETLRNILEYVNDYYGEDISIQSISKKFNLNTCYFSQLFKRETGMTFTDYFADLRIKNARSMLSNTAMTINEISEKVGFNDYYYFTRVFKKMVGVTPAQYREK